MCKTAFYDNKIKLLSDGSPQRDFIHISDVFNAVNALIQTKTKEFQNNTYHVSSGKTLTILQLAHVVKSVYKLRYKKDIQIILPDKTISENPNIYSKSERFTVDNSKLKSIGFKPTISLSTGINEIFEYLENIK